MNSLEQIVNKKHHKTRVMIIDDDPISRELMLCILQTEGYEIATRANGIGLIDELQRYQPDVLLMDVMMPETNGFELCKQLKSDKHWQHLPIVLVTSLREKEELVAGLDAGADDFISKPVRATELRARVRSMYRVKQRADLLISSARQRTDLAHMIVHDMRTPLSVCMLRTELLQGLVATEAKARTDNQKLYSSIGTVRDQLQDLHGQMDQILLLAKSEHSTVSIMSKSEDLGELLRQVVQEHVVLAERCNISLHLDAPAGPTYHDLDKAMMSRVLGNLLSNALKFSPDGSKISLRLTAGQAPHSWQIEVCDEGPGIPAFARHLIFDRYAVASAEQREIRSIGLGLAFCRMVVEAHDGTISIRDNAPTGTIFTIAL